MQTPSTDADANAPAAGDTPAPISLPSSYSQYTPGAVDADNISKDAFLQIIRNLKSIKPSVNATNTVTTMQEPHIESNTTNTNSRIIQPYEYAECDDFPCKRHKPTATECSSHISEQALVDEEPIQSISTSELIPSNIASELTTTPMQIIIQSNPCVHNIYIGSQPVEQTQQTASPGKAFGYVYAVCHKDKPKLIKIGYTRRCIYERVNELCGSGMPSNEPHDIVSVMITDDPVGLEKKMHHKFRDRRSFKEFFEVSKEEVARAFESEIQNAMVVMLANLNEYRNLKDRLHSKEIESHKYRITMSRIECENTKLKEAVKELNALTERVANLEKENTKLREEVSELNALVKNIGGPEKKIAKLREEISKLNALTKCVNNPEQKTTKLNVNIDEVNALIERITKLEKENTQLREDFNSIGVLPDRVAILEEINTTQRSKEPSWHDTYDKHFNYFVALSNCFRNFEVSNVSYENHTLFEKYKNTTIDIHVDEKLKLFVQKKIIQQRYYITCIAGKFSNYDHMVAQMLSNIIGHENFAYIMSDQIKTVCDDLNERMSEVISQCETYENLFSFDDSYETHVYALPDASTKIEELEEYKNVMIEQRSFIISVHRQLFPYKYEPINKIGVTPDTRTDIEKLMEYVNLVNQQRSQLMNLQDKLSRIQDKMIEKGYVYTSE